MPLKSLSAAISIALLKPARALSYLSERDEDTPGADDAYDSYLLSSDVLEQVHKSIIGAASSDSEIASPVILSWTLILHRMNVSYQGRTEKRDNLLLQNARENFEAGPVARPPTVRRNSAGSIFSIESSRFDGFLENSTTPKDLQVVEQLATGVTAHGRVYDVMSRMASNVGSIIDGSMPPLTSSRIRATFLEVLKVSYPIIGYQSDPMSCLLSLLSTGKDYWDIATERHLAPEDDVVAAMVEDDYLLEFYFQQALDRYPYEFLPFISLCRALCTDTNVDGDEKPDLILNLLRRTPTLTFVLPPSFQQYELVQEDENTNSFSLLEEIPLISLSASWRRRIIEDEAFRLPVGTYGRFLTDTGRVVQVEYPHSSLALLGRRLEINLMPEGYQTELGMMEPQEVAEVISLFATLIRIDKSRSTAADSTSIVLQSESDIIAEASKHIAGGKDLVTIVCDTMDSFLQEERAMGDDSSLSVLNSCIQFLDSILPFFPNRVWSHLARSDLLDSDSRAGKLVRITSTLDLVSSRFDFLNSSANFFSNLIDSAMTSAVQRQLGNKSLGRQRPESNPWSGTANKVLARVSYYIAQASVDIFENTSTWRFESEEQRVLLIGNVVPILDKIIRYSYSMGDIESSECLTSTLRPAAEYVVDCFLEPATGTLRFKPILTSLIIAFTSPHDTLYPNRFYALSKQTKSILRFSTTVLRVSNLLDRSSGMIENYLFKSCTLLVRLCAVSDHFRTPALWLIKALVVNAGKSTNEPPSLLGYLGPQTSKSFLQLLSMLCKPFVLSSEVKTTWRFFSAILRNRQQWMSNCLLTGQTPREAMKKDLKKTESSPDSIFATALNKLSGLKDLDPEQALYILDFVASAQNYWPWTVFTLQKDTSYMDGLRAYVRDLKPSQLTVKSSVSRAAVEARVAAYVAETFAMQLYHSRHLGDVDALAKKLAADLDYYLRDGVEVAGYNKSLHINFAKNFANKYSGCSLDNFKRTLLEPRELGTSYYYDLDRADTMLRFDPGWLGRKDNGFKTEMGLANANLSLVDAQIVSKLVTTALDNQH
jgi:nuclear pore complex protein Nup188